jgi:hypothetical protein
VHVKWIPNRTAQCRVKDKDLEQTYKDVQRLTLTVAQLEFRMSAVEEAQRELEIRFRDFGREIRKLQTDFEEFTELMRRYRNRSK